MTITLTHIPFPQHRTTSADIIIIQTGTATMLTPHDAFEITADGKGSYKKENLTETTCHPGQVIVQRGQMHAWSNRSSDDWIRLLCVVLDAEKQTLMLSGGGVGGEVAGKRALEEIWLQ
jgi:hypothetical protein